MKKYLISTLTAAAAMAVPAFSAELIDSWDFSQTSEQQTGVTSVAGSQGTLTLVTGGTTGSTIYTAGSSSSGNGYLDIVPTATNKTYIDVSGASLTTEEGISIVLTIDNWGSGSGGAIFASFETQNDNTHVDAAAIGIQGTGSPRPGWFAANGTTGTVDVDSSLPGVSFNFTSEPLVVTLTFVGNILSIYEGGELVCQAVIKEETYSTISGSITEVVIGSWESSSTSQEFSDLRLVSMEIYSGDIMAVPEPSMFGLLFGLGAIGLVATRRRRRA